MTEERKPRTTRENEARDLTWAPPDKLATPEPPPGFKYRWVRYETRGQEDRQNLRSREKQNYRYVMAEELKNSGQEYDEIKNGPLQGVVSVGDLVLMMVPVEVAEQRNAYFAQRTRRMQQAVDQELDRNNTDVMPIERRNKSTVTTGRPAFQDD